MRPEATCASREDEEKDAEQSRMAFVGRPAAPAAARPAHGPPRCSMHSGVPLLCVGLRARPAAEGSGELERKV
eukprot:5217410-Alexandrium_andersonii.AAC.1